jgi:subtilisin family serine protease
MDPALAELIEAGDADDDVRVVVRTTRDAAPPPWVEVVSQFGDVGTWRVKRRDVRRTWEAPETESVKGARLLGPAPVGVWVDPGPRGSDGLTADDERRPAGLRETGQGVIVACLDWGVDFAHPDFRTPTGDTRLLALWDQRSGAKPGTAPRYGYGRVHDRRAIDAALATGDPYTTLGYHPADSDLGHGSHGTHCLSIAAGTGSDATPRGVAPRADLLFVHLDSPRAGEGESLGDWVTLLDALDYCLRTAGARPLVVSMSLGSEGGPHDGSTPVERALDFAVSAAPGRAICQSTGNYYEAKTHTSGWLRPGDSDRIGWMTTQAETNPHQLEVWYAGADRIVARIESREHELIVTARPGDSRRIELDGVTVGRIHHRTAEPNNGKNHVNVFLYPAAPGGRWDVVLDAVDVADGRYHCWVERESASPGGQSHLDDTDIVKRYTTNSVCNGLRTITVGAYDGRTPDRPPASYTSAGPTSDGRPKPDVSAPGVQVLAARSTPRGEAPGDRCTRMSGTSMAAPYVAGTIALMFEAAGRPMTIAETRRHLSRTVEAADPDDDSAVRLGDGYVDIEHAVAATRAAGREPIEEDPEMTPVVSDTANGASIPDGNLLERFGVSPAELFDGLRAGVHGERLVPAVTVIAAPGSRLSVEPHQGDILLSRVRGERDRGRCAVVHDGVLHDRERCRALGHVLRDTGRGLYVRVRGEDGVIIAIRIADVGRRLPLRHMLIRPADAAAPSPGRWEGEGWDEAMSEWLPESAPVVPGRLVIDTVPLLASHRGTHPDLILHWNAMPDGVALVDIAIHFHGWAANGESMRLDVDKEPKSGLDFSNPLDPADPTPGRSRPTLCILPRGNYISGRAYNHPALVTPTGLQDLISFSLGRFKDATGAQPAIGQLILTAHSGGGAGLMGALRHNVPDEVHAFDALYGPADRLVGWAQKRIQAEAGGGETGALRILFRDGEDTAANSRAVAQALAPLLASSSVPGIADRYRAQATTVRHCDIPARFGWLLLANAAAPLPVRGPGKPVEAVPALAAVPAETDDDALRAQWDAHPRVHGWFDGGLSTYLAMAALFAANGITDAAAYLDQNITTARLLGHSFPAHSALAAALAQADAALRDAAPPPDVHSIWAINARPIRGRAGSLSQHALGLAVDINPDTNPLIRAGDDGDVVRVINAVTGVNLGAAQTADAMRQASLTFKATYGDAWITARRQDLDAATQAGDTTRATELQQTLAAATRQRTRLAQLAQTGFFDLDQRLIDALQAAGLTWGGSWRTSKDFMHFELHLPVAPGAAQSAEAFDAPEDDPGGGGVVTAAQLHSWRFRQSSARSDLEAVANGRLRLGRAGDSQDPAPIRSSGGAVKEIQLALIELGWPLPKFGADGSYGEETYQAVLAYKRQYNILTASGDLDGIVGPKTILHIDAALPLTAVSFRLCVDSDRNGKLVPAPTTWQWGSAGKGGIVLVNNDDDGGNSHPDNEDKFIDAGNDVHDVAPLMIERMGSGSVPAGTKLELSVSDKDRIRVFQPHATGANEIVGPTAGARHEFKDLTPKQIKLGMEAIRYAEAGFSGEMTITLRWTDPLGAVSTVSTVVRAAPWVVFNHLDAAERVFVVDAGAFNQRFRNDLRALVTAAGCTLVEFKRVDDIWMQDCMEFGHARLPGTALRTVQRAPRDRPLQHFPRTLLRADLGFVAEGTPGDATFNSTGNLEATPPVTSAAGKRYPLGRIYYGPGRPGEPLNADVRAFLRGQVVQDPIELDTGWLRVGHVDEVISFVPSNPPKGFALLLASPKRGFEILDALRVAHATDKVLVGRTFPVIDDDGNVVAVVPVEQKISELADRNDDVSPQLQFNIAAGEVAHTAGTLRDYNKARQGNIDTIRAKLKTELGLDESDIIDVPALFMPNGDAPTQADALTAGMVNMLVINGHCIVPKPFGPVVGGVDKFEEDLTGKLTPLGLTVRFLDCWDEYHVALGEVHCATNALRKVPATNWWDFQP